MNVNQYRQCTYNVTLGGIHSTTVAVKKQLSIIHPVCVVAVLGVQRAIRMRHTVTGGCPALQHFSTLSHKRHDFRKKKKKKKKLLNIKCVLRVSLQLLCEAFLILRIIERGTIKKNVYWPSYKVPLILVGF